MFKKGKVEDVETAETTNQETYRRYKVNGEWFTAFKECKGSAEKGQTVAFKYVCRGDYRNITEFLHPEAIAEDDSYFRMLSNQVFTELKARNIRVLAETYEKEWLATFEVLDRINKALRVKR